MKFLRTNSFEELNAFEIFHITLDRRVFKQLDNIKCVGISKYHSREFIERFSPWPFYMEAMCPILHMKLVAEDR